MMLRDDPSLSLPGQRLSERILAIFIFCILTLSMAVAPLIAEVDPWHGHVILGAANSAEYTRALLNHRHSEVIDHPEDPSSAASDTLVLSVAEREMLSSLSAFASYTPLVPVLLFALLVAPLLLSLDMATQNALLLFAPAPPSPPPRLTP